MPMYKDPRMEEEERRRRMSREGIARSQVQQQQMAAKQGVSPIAQSRGNPLQQLGKAALGQALGPLGPLAGLLFNKGGHVPMQGYNTGGWLQALFGKLAGNNPNRRRMEEEKKRRMQQGQQTLAQQINWPGAQRRNMGGPLSNPYGYNEGGQAMETPLKKVMEEDKIELARMAAMNAERRKDEKAAADEQRAQEKHQLDMTMKKKAATTNKTPLSAKE